MLDSLNLEEMGVPTVTFVTPPFVLAAQAMAQSRGRDDLAFVIVSESEVDEGTVSDAALHAIVHLLSRI